MYPSSALLELALGFLCASWSFHVWKAAAPWSQAQGKKGGGPAACLASSFPFPSLWGLRLALEWMGL